MLTSGKSQANQDKLASSVSFGTILTVTPVILHSHPPKLPPKARKKPGPSGILSKGGEAPLGCSSRHPPPVPEACGLAEMDMRMGWPGR